VDLSTSGHKYVRECGVPHRRHGGLALLAPNGGGVPVARRWELPTGTLRRCGRPRCRRRPVPIVALDHEKDPADLRAVSIVIAGYQRIIKI